MAGASVRVILVLAAAILYGSAYGKENTVRFVIVPGGGTGEAVVPLDTPPIADSTCIFKYNVYGATTESWFGKIAANPQTQEIQCTIYRAGEQETYLLFNSYEITVGTEEATEVTSATVTDGEGDVLESEAYEIEANALRQSKSWSGSILKFDIQAKYYL